MKAINCYEWWSYLPSDNTHITKMLALVTYLLMEGSTWKGWLEAKLHQFEFFKADTHSRIWLAKWKTDSYKETSSLTCISRFLDTAKLISFFLFIPKIYIYKSQARSEQRLIQHNILYLIITQISTLSPQNKKECHNELLLSFLAIVCKTLHETLASQASKWSLKASPCGLCCNNPGGW